MKKFALILIIVFACILIIGCVSDTVSYCPYCSSINIEKTAEGTFRCKNSSCGKTFGAIKL